MLEIPEYITHYHLADKCPFLNLSDLDGDELDRALDELTKRRQAEPGFNRRFGRRYMELRQRTEAKIRHLFQ